MRRFLLFILIILSFPFFMFSCTNNEENSKKGHEQEEQTLAIYTIRFLNYNGDVLQTITCDSETEPIYTGNTPIKESTEAFDYIFNGWNKEIVKPTEDTDYTAVFLEKEIEKIYHIFLNVNTGATVTISQLDVKIGESYDLSPLAVGLMYDKSEYNFNAWKDDNNKIFPKTGTWNYNYDITLHLDLRKIWTD